jgi:hypothetical protein
MTLKGVVVGVDGGRDGVGGGQLSVALVMMSMFLLWSLSFFSFLLISIATASIHFYYLLFVFLSSILQSFLPSI